MGFVILPRGILGTKRFSNISKKTLSRLARLESLTLRFSWVLSKEWAEDRAGHRDSSTGLGTKGRRGSLPWGSRTAEPWTAGTFGIVGTSGTSV